MKAQHTVRFDVEVHAKLVKIAKKEHRSVANMVEFLVLQKIEGHETEYGEIELTDEDLSLE